MNKIMDVRKQMCESKNKQTNTLNGKITLNGQNV